MACMLLSSIILINSQNKYSIVKILVKQIITKRNRKYLNQQEQKLYFISNVNHVC